MSETRIKGVWLHRRAEMALRALPPGERRKVKWALRLLGDPEAWDLVTANSSRLPVPERTYVFRATPDVRILFEDDSDEGEPERALHGRERWETVRVLDIARADALKNCAVASSRGRDHDDRPERGRAPSRRGLGRGGGGSR